MGVLFAFLTGWIIGARGGKDGYEDVVTAAKELATSEEMATLSVAVRRHLGYSLKQLGEWLSDPATKLPDVDDVLARAQRLVGRSNEFDDD
jgi:hypothetical protein